MKPYLAVVLMVGTAFGQVTFPCSAARPQNCIGGGDPSRVIPPITVTDVGLAPATSESQSSSITVAGGARIVAISNADYARLQKLRQAVMDAEMEIAKAHGVYFAPVHCYIESITCPHPESHSYLSTCDRMEGCPEKPSDRYQFRGQFLLVNVPKGKP